MIAPTGKQTASPPPPEATSRAVVPPQFQALRNEAAPPAAAAGLEVVLDIPLQVTVELGRAEMLIKDVLELGVGSVVELDKASDEPVNVMVGGRLVAQGEVVVIDENFGVRITKVVGPLPQGGEEKGRNGR